MPDLVEEATQRFLATVNQAAKVLSNEITKLSHARAREVMQRAFFFDESPPGPPEQVVAVASSRQHASAPLKVKIYTADALLAQVIAFVKKYPGFRLEQLNSRLGTKTSDLTVPIRKAIASGKLVTKGYGRARKYFPGKKA